MKQPKSPRRKFADLLLQASDFALWEVERDRREVRRASREQILLPQVIVTLTPGQDHLQAELPGRNGFRQIVALDRNVGDTLLRILQGQARGAIELGLDGRPTNAQVLHWERHEIFPGDRCKFCLAEGRLATRSRPSRGRVLSEHTVGDGSVTVRRIAPKGKAAKMAQRSLRSAEELGL